MKKLILTVFFALFITLTAWADNADLSPQEAYGRIFSSTENQVAQYFAPEFLKAIPAEKIIEITKIYNQALGAYKSVRHTDDGYRLEFEKGEAASRISINADNKIASLWFGAPELVNDNLEAVKKAFAELPGKVSVCLLHHDSTTGIASETFVINQLTPLGCGSAFKLYLLKALDESVKSGKRNWTDIVELREEWKSFPSGVLQDWPAGSKHTLETVAGLMISISDNTATDHIYNILGSETVRAYFPASCVDLYNTSQLLKLKFFFPARAKEFVKADTEGKKAIIKEMDAVKTSEIASYSAIYEIDNPILVEEIEWFVSTRNLCDTIYSLRDNHLLRINPATGLVNKQDWNIAGFKGGSEPGVLNYTWVLQKTPTSPFYTLSCSINDPVKPVDDNNFNIAVARMLKLIEAL
ncbi:MAG: class A beta-lactamase-related serine hydrolase [Candidatus Riflebacteria bacterium]|nr:class A beta-lactamase-related serine hydrolase [Candidatus Riflebacteria bacterium]